MGPIRYVPRASRLRACGIASETRSFRTGHAGNALWSISSTTHLVDDDFQDTFGRSRVITVRHYVNEASPDKCVIGPVPVVEAAPAARFNDGDIICRDGGDRQMCGIGARDVGGAVLGHWAVQVRTADRSRHAPGSAMKIDKIDPPARVKFVRYSWAGGSPVGDWAGNPRAESQGAIVG